MQIFSEMEILIYAVGSNAINPSRKATIVVNLFATEPYFLMRQIRDFLRAEHFVINTNIINHAGEKATLLKRFIRAEVQAAIGINPAYKISILGSLHSVHVQAPFQSDAVIDKADVMPLAVGDG
jgi:hypothetical protein